MKSKKISISCVHLFLFLTLNFTKKLKFRYLYSLKEMPMAGLPDTNSGKRVIYRQHAQIQLNPVLTI